MEFKSGVDWKGAIWQMTPFVKIKLYSIFKEKVVICQMVPFVTK